MSQICNKISDGFDPLTPEFPRGASLAAITEYHVEQGSAMLSSCLRSIASAISAIELHKPAAVRAHIQGASEACKIAVAHYRTVQEIDPNRGATDSEIGALQALDIENAFARWTSYDLIPDLAQCVKDVSIAAKDGGPAAMLNVFNHRLEKANQCLQSVLGSGLTSNHIIQWEIWRALSTVTEALLTGQMIAIVYREATSLTKQS